MLLIADVPNQEVFFFSITIDLRGKGVYSSSTQQRGHNEIYWFKHYMCVAPRYGVLS